MINTWGFVDSHKKQASVAREVNFGAAVASMLGPERLAIETTIGMGMKVLNGTTYVYHFQCEIVFLGQHIEWVWKHVAVGGGRFLTSSESVQHASKTRLKCI